MTDIEYIASKLSREDILCQLAEEASELAQAALKLRRALTGTNPTPVSVNGAKLALNEEIADVAAALESWFKSEVEIETGDIKSALGALANAKIARWAQRLRDAENTNCTPVTPTDAPTDTPTVGKTRQEKFLEMFPRAAICQGTLDICPEKADIRLRDCENYYDCLDCRKEYWHAVEKEGANE